MDRKLRRACPLPMLRDVLPAGESGFCVMQAGSADAWAQILILVNDLAVRPAYRAGGIHAELRGRGC